ncbi:MAG: hypothetical protein DRQ46_00245 [Gammaproteobacteria bacterium]|nr:MAG: hypothetical protein DRQ46_00245 [Gammaproteobacteria bacterium]
MWITAFFYKNGIPEKGLTPTISGWRISDNVKVVDGAAMTEVNDAATFEVFYKYQYNAPDNGQYYFSVDGGVSLSNFDRYKGGEGSELLENIILDTDSIKSTVDTNLDVAVSTRSSHSAADVWAVGSRTLTSFGTLVVDVTSAVWSAGTRTLTGVGTLVADIWAYVTRSLTDKADFTIAGTKQTLDSLNDITAAAVDAQLTGSHNAGSWNPADISGIATEANATANRIAVIAEVDQNEALLIALGALTTAIKAKTDNLPADPATVTNQNLINAIVTLTRKLMTGSEAYDVDNETIVTLDDDDSTPLKEHKALNKDGSVINKTQYNETTPAGRTQLVDP